MARVWLVGLLAHLNDYHLARLNSCSLGNGDKVSPQRALRQAMSKCCFFSLQAMHVVQEMHGAIPRAGSVHALNDMQSLQSRQRLQLPRPGTCFDTHFENATMPSMDQYIKGRAPSGGQQMTSEHPTRTQSITCGGYNDGCITALV